MELIGENIHIISKKIKEALVSKDESFIKELIKKQKSMDYVDLNVGPAKGNLENILPWLINLAQNESIKGLSLDTTNSIEMKKGLECCKGFSNIIINSASDDKNRLESMTDLAAEYNTKLIALTLNNSIGIPQTADERIELALDIYETCSQKDISNERIYFDPLILPISVNQSQANEALNTVKMLKESFDPACNTVVGLSNISNGSPKELRPLINRVFLAIAYGAGLDCAIVDATDSKLYNMVKMLESKKPDTKADELLLNLGSIISDFVDIAEIEYDKSDKESVDIYKTACIIMNKNIYSHSFTQI
ncbi:dihydropteroate synthase [bacterium]|nr:dihydropteroate synthase [bacterium]